ncbi:hypothetical protein ACFWY9_28685 [Amycolatopsis sp. NPDC059027]|uniref:hypothetical protein n=1 Tax=Amycolatopsis sp. NPDC059027 TaxID=3346709 RepID=UPI0036707D4D
MAYAEFTLAHTNEPFTIGKRVEYQAKAATATVLRQVADSFGRGGTETLVYIAQDLRELAYGIEYES